MSLKTLLQSLRFATNGKVEAVTAAPETHEADLLEAFLTAPEARAPLAPARILLDTLRLADNGKVQCHVAAPDGTVVQGVIEASFFDEFMTSPLDKIDTKRKGRIIQDNVDYLEEQADRLWREGNRELVIR